MKQKNNYYDINLKIVLIKSDNTNVINLTKNLVLHSHTKFIEIRRHFIKDHDEKKDYIIEYVSPSNQLEDLFTKLIPKQDLIFIRIGLGILN